MQLSWIGIVSAALLCVCGEAAGSGGATGALAGAWNDGPGGLYFSQTYDPVSGLDRRATLFAGDRWAENPKGDLGQFDFAAAAPASSGRWTLAGDRLTMTPVSGPPREGPVVMNPDKCFDFRDGIWCPATPFATGAIDGAYSGGASYASSAAVATDYVFAPDGTYRLLAAGSFKEPGEPDSRVTSAGESAGRYRIEGFTLILTASDGTERRDIAFPFGESADGAKPPYIYFGGWLLARQAD